MSDLNQDTHGPDDLQHEVIDPNSRRRDPNRPRPVPNRSQTTPTPRDVQQEAPQQDQTPIPGTADNFRQLIDLLSLPKTSMVKFNGDPMMYHSFMNSFNTNVDSMNVNDSYKLNRLLELCEGKARTVISSCMLGPPAEGYKTARKLLRERFGDDYVISESWIAKICNGPPVKTNSCDSIQSFTDEVRSCVETLKSMDRLAEVDTRSRQVQLMRRLPERLQDRWRRKVVSYRDDNEKYPSITEFLAFLDNVSREASDPVFGIGAVSDDRDSKSNQKNKPRQSKSLIVDTASAPQPAPTQPETREQARCPLCDQRHPLYACSDFKKMTPPRRLEFAREKRLCYSCLRPARHSAKACRTDRICNIDGCPMKHSRFLHAPLANERTARQTQDTTGTAEETVTATGEAAVPPVATANTAAVRSFGKTALPVVAVTVTATNGRSKEVFALLDTGSDRSFCSKYLLQELQTQGKAATFNVSTLNDGRKLHAQEVSLFVSPVKKDHACTESIMLPQVYCIDNFPKLASSIATSRDVRNYDHLRDLPLPDIDADAVHLLIGQDCPDAMIPLECRRGASGQPFAVRTPLGWTVNGPLNDGRNERIVISNFIMSEDGLFEENHDPKLSPTRAMSVNDRKALKTWDESLRVVNGHYQLDVPFKQLPPDLPDNKFVAEKRFQHLQRRIGTDRTFGDRYRKTVQEYLDNGYAEKCQEKHGPNGWTWYIPHHAVLNVHKPEKLRVVFDCAAEYQGISINKAVHQGPDFTNRLLGVLFRFRERPVVIVADVKAMYHQVQVTPDHRDALRFLWYDKDGSIVPYRMCVHLFGGIWSASVACYALKRVALDHMGQFDRTVIDTVLMNFYVDDLLHSLDTEEQAIKTADDLRRLLATRGFELTKWMSNSRAVLQSIPTAHHAKNVKDIDLEDDPLPRERALGVSWLANEDLLQISAGNKVARFTKRGLISHYSMVYDPLGFVTPFVLVARLLYRKECQLNKGWDDELEAENEDRFRIWIDKLPTMAAVSVPRCIASPNMTNAQAIELHHFCDASESAYATVSYIRVVQHDGIIHCAYLFGKARLAPLKIETVPRLELMAATLAVQNHLLLTTEMTLKFTEVYFWSDSTVVLGQIKSKDRRFPRFTANRIAAIHQSSTPDQWRYISTDDNPADVATRGSYCLDRWLNAPRFMFDDCSSWPSQPLCLVNETTGDDSPTDRLLHHFSSIEKLKRSVAWLCKFGSWLSDKNGVLTDISPEEIDQALHSVVRYVQKTTYTEEHQRLLANRGLVRSSPLYILEPYIDDSSLIRVGGRLKNSENAGKNQILLPAKHHVTLLIARDLHANKCFHSGIEYMLAVLRSSFWVPRVRPLLSRIMRECIVCRKLAVRPMRQRMADLPPERLADDASPFKYVGIDCFGPVVVNRGRSTVKRYGLILTCMTIRAIHLEVLPTLSTNAFIDGLRRFISKRGVPEKIVSDNGTNFVGAQRELGEALTETTGRKTLRHFLLQRKISWSFNPPLASHMGGSWERLIRSVRRAFNATVGKTTLDDFELMTVFSEIEAMVNNRPLTKASEDSNDMTPLTPSILLQLGPTCTPPPVVGSETDKYRRRWRYIQHLADEFWRRWRTEYLPSIQHRRKWIATSPNAHVGDLVLVMDQRTCRNDWPLGRIEKVHVGRDGLVRSCEITTTKGQCTRPITKLCLLEAATD